MKKVTSKWQLKSTLPFVYKNLSVAEKIII